MVRIQLRLTALATGAIIGSLVAGAVLAEGNTSGPSAGTDVTPSAAVQKQHQSGTGTGYSQQSTAGQQQSASGGAGIEAKQGTEGGASPDDHAR
jgi:hypothetical protein